MIFRQQELLEAFSEGDEIIANLGSGLNYKKKGLRRLLELILFKRIHRLVLTQGSTITLWLRIDLCPMRDSKHRDRHHQQRRAT
jgi:hypothetical protein